MLCIEEAIATGTSDIYIVLLAYIGQEPQYFEITTDCATLDHYRGTIRKIFHDMWPSAGLIYYTSTMLTNLLLH